MVTRVQDRMIHWMSNRLNKPVVSPMNASINITSRCNSRCRYCDIWEREVKSRAKEPTVPEIAGLIDSLHQLGVKDVILSGGEPLLRDDLEEIIALFNNKMAIGIVTNGILLSKERIDELIKAGLKSIGLSLDTFDPEIYEKLRGIPFKFAEQALDTLIYAMKQNPQLNAVANCVVSSYNIGKLPQFVFEFLERTHKTIGINFQGYTRVPGRIKDELIPTSELYPVFTKEIARLIRMKTFGVPILNSKSYLQALPDFLIKDRLKRNSSCNAGYTTVTIDENLQLLPCPYMPATSDLRKENLKDAWGSQKMQAVRNRMSKGQCRGCLCVTYRDDSINPLRMMIMKYGRDHAQKAMMRADKR